LIQTKFLQKQEHERIYAAFLLIKIGEISIDDVNPTLKNSVEKLMKEVR
jgi:hypothetical protein